MGPFSFLLDGIYVATTTAMGRGIFTKNDIAADTLIEIAPVVVLSGDERKLIDQTLLHDYIFEWGKDGEQCCMALGYVSVYNHSYQSNCEYEMDFELEIISVRTIRTIAAGEELFINYNGDWDDEKKVWFETADL